MAARKRAKEQRPESNLARSEAKVESVSVSESKPEARPLAPPKTSFIATISLFVLAPYFSLVFFHNNIPAEYKNSIAINGILSFIAFLATLYLIPVLPKPLLRRGIFGKDINKKGTPLGAVPVPEAMGIMAAVVFVVVVNLFVFINHSAHSDWPLVAVLSSIVFMILLGFMDDVLDTPWRVKLLFSSIAALPLLLAYTGHTTIIIPKPLVPYFGHNLLDLGRIYKLYMWLLAIFCTNSINIHAGLNGLEVGQTVVIACAVLIHNLMRIGASADLQKQAHAFSIYLVQPLLATSLALLAYNWYPSSVFVGDTYTYFAGMTLAVAGIMGHFSETLLLFFAPQVINFLLSLPQLFGFIPCPRHRLPKFDPQTGLLTGTNDGTLVNVFLRLFGTRSEKSLCIHLLVFQALCCCLTFVLRWFLTGWYK